MGVIAFLMGLSGLALLYFGGTGVRESHQAMKEGTGQSSSGAGLIVSLGMMLLGVVVMVKAVNGVKYSKVDWMMEQNAPTSTLTHLTDGHDFKLYELHGKPVFVNVWAPWCGPCVNEMPDIYKLSKQSKGAYEVVTVSADDLSSLRDHAKRNPLPKHSYRVAEGDAFFGKIRTIPTTFIIGADGQIKESHVGSMSFKSMQKMINKHQP